MTQRAYDIAQLILTDLRGELTDEQRTELDTVLLAYPEYRRLYDALSSGPALHEGLRQFAQVDKEPARRAVLKKIFPDGDARNSAQPAHRVHFLKTAWFRYAAAIILLFVVGAYLWHNAAKKDNVLVQQSKPVPAEKDIAPGSNRAILTLSDGRKVELTTDKRSIADAGLTIENTYGKLLYGKGGDVAYNTMTTPKGGQYQITLPDGTNVWMNAASSITYPTAFVGASRAVKISGEMYFEVAKNAQQPFVVDVDGKASVEVLGTHFNINSYTDEPSVKATLLAGKVRVKKGNDATALSPGQQAVIGQTIRVANIDVQRTVAWKNGFFDFEDKKLSEAMRELARWYDIEVSYAPGVKDIEFIGNMSRNLQLSQVLQGLQQVGVHFILQDNRRLIVQP